MLTKCWHDWVNPSAAPYRPGYNVPGRTHLIGNVMSEELCVDLECVYAGKCLLTSGKLGVVYYTINGDGSLGERRVFGFKKDFERSLGYIYTGAKWSDTQVTGLNLVRGTGKRWEDIEMRLRWKAEENAALVTKRKATAEAAQKKTNEYDDILLPIRRVYTAALRRGDMIGAQAIEQTVLMSLKRPARPSDE